MKWFAVLGMTSSVVALIVATTILTVLLTSCGKPNCVNTIHAGDELTFGTLEELRCPDDQFIAKVEPNRLPGGIVSHLTVTCMRVVGVCK